MSRPGSTLRKRGRRRRRKRRKKLAMPCLDVVSLRPQPPYLLGPDGFIADGGLEGDEDAWIKGQSLTPDLTTEKES
jgi:hypothetical protein